MVGFLTAKEAAEAFFNLGKGVGCYRDGREVNGTVDGDVGVRRVVWEGGERTNAWHGAG